MKKLLYSSLLLVGLVASYQMQARAPKSGELQEARADRDQLVARIGDLQTKMLNSNYEGPRSYTLKDKASDILDAVAPERNKHETVELLERAKTTLNSKQHPKNKLKVIAGKVDEMERLS